jgi:hypothetical protein
MPQRHTPVYTIGHSTHPADELIDWLKAFEVHTLVDVRTVPRSLISDVLVARKQPVFHIMSPTSAPAHKLREWAVVKRGKVTYPEVGEKDQCSKETQQTGRPPSKNETA